MVIVAIIAVVLLAGAVGDRLRRAARRRTLRRSREPRARSRPTATSAHKPQAACERNSRRARRSTRSPPRSATPPRGRFAGVREDEIQRELDLGRLLQDRRPAVPRLPRPLHDRRCRSSLVWFFATARHVDRRSSSSSVLVGLVVRLGRAELLRPPPRAPAPAEHRRRAPGADRSARRHARGRRRLRRRRCG